MFLSLYIYVCVFIYIYKYLYWPSIIPAVDFFLRIDLKGTASSASAPHNASWAFGNFVNPRASRAAIFTMSGLVQEEYCVP